MFGPRPRPLEAEVYYTIVGFNIQVDIIGYFEDNFVGQVPETSVTAEAQWQSWHTLHRFDYSRDKIDVGCLEWYPVNIGAVNVWVSSGHGNSWKMTVNLWSCGTFIAVCTDY